MSNTKDSFKERQKKKIIIVIVILIATCVIGAGIYANYQNPPSNKETTTTISQPEQTKTLSQVAGGKSEITEYFDGYTITLNKNYYVIKSNDTSADFSGNYLIKEINIEDIDVKNVNMADYDSAYMICCLYNEHHYGKETEFYNGSKTYSFDFLLLNNKSGLYKLVGSKNFNQDMLDKPIF